MAYYNNVVKSGAWSNAKLFTDVSRPYSEIYGKKWGIIGLGGIGREVAKVATAFGAEVSYHSTSGNIREEIYPHQDLKTLLKTCDIISIHAPLNAKTKNLIHAGNLPYMKEKALLLNLGRGSIVNESDLAIELDKPGDLCRSGYACTGTHRKIQSSYACPASRNGWSLHHILPGQA